jgi:hypothetical protein
LFTFCFIRRAMFEELELTYPDLTAGAFLNTTSGCDLKLLVYAASSC